MTLPYTWSPLALEMSESSDSILNLNLQLIFLSIETSDRSNKLKVMFDVAAAMKTTLHPMR